MNSSLPTIPPEVWRRSPRPGSGLSVRLFAAGFVGLLGLFFANPFAQWGFLGLAVVVFFAAIPIADSRLGPMEREVDKVDRAGANALLKALPDRRIVRWFAPGSWLNIQKAKLHLRRGDARAAAMALGEARQQNALGSTRPELRSAEAEAHLQADDRKRAMTILSELAGAGSLRPYDAMNYGVLALSDARRSPEALENLEAAESLMGDHPRLWAALALAQQKAGDAAQGRLALERAEELLEGADDVIARDLAKRAKKGLRAPKSTRKDRRRKGKGKGQHKSAESQKSTEAQPAAAKLEVAEAAPRHADAKSASKKQKATRKGSKKSRKAARREERRKQRSEEREAKRIAASRDQVAHEREEARKLQARVEADRGKAATGASPAVSSFPTKSLFSPKLPPIGSAAKPAAKPASALTFGAPGKAKPGLSAKPGLPAKPAPPSAGSLFKPLALGTPSSNPAASKPAASKPAAPPPFAAAKPAAPKPAAPPPFAAAKPAAPKPAAPKPAAPKPAAPKPAAPPPFAAPKGAPPRLAPPPVLAPPPMVNAPSAPGALSSPPAPALPDNWDDLFSDVPAAPAPKPKP